MFFSVILAYAVATAFAFCGVVNAVGYVMECEQGMGSCVFIEGMTLAMWPLAVATALLMLIQIACKLERWMLLWTMAQATPAPVQKAPRPAAKAAPAPRGEPISEENKNETIPQPPRPLPPVPPQKEQEGLNFFKID